MTSAEKLLRAFLRIGGTVCGSAIFAVFMPREWMAFCHERLDLGTLPDAPIVEYLARSTSLFYAIFGVVLWMFSRDVRRFAGSVITVGVGMMVCGAILLMIDLRAGLPFWWTAIEGPFVVGIGAVMLTLAVMARRSAKR